MREKMLFSKTYGKNQEEFKNHRGSEDDGSNFFNTCSGVRIIKVTNKRKKRRDDSGKNAQLDQVFPNCFFGIARLEFHDAFFRGIRTQSERGQSIREQVDPKQLERRVGKR